MAKVCFCYPFPFPFTPPKKHTAISYLPRTSRRSGMRDDMVKLIHRHIINDNMCNTYFGMFHLISREKLYLLVGSMYNTYAWLRYIVNKCATRGWSNWLSMVISKGGWVACVIIILWGLRRMSLFQPFDKSSKLMVCHRTSWELVCLKIAARISARV